MKLSGPRCLLVFRALMALLTSSSEMGRLRSVHCEAEKDRRLRLENKVEARVSSKPVFAEYRSEMYCQNTTNTFTGLLEYESLVTFR